MKRVIFDLSVCQPIGNIKFHGGGVYGYIVFAKLANEYPSNIVVYFDSKRFIPEHIVSLIEKNKIEKYDSSHISLQNAYIKGHCQKIYSPLYKESYHSLIKTDIPLMVTIHGLRALELNRDKYEIYYAQDFWTLLKVIIKQTPFYRFLQKKYHRQYDTLLKCKNVSVVTVSQHSKASILYYYPHINSDNIEVRYSPNTSDESIVARTDAVEEKYYLIISSNRWIKNAYRALKAFETLLNMGCGFDAKIYVVGIDSKHKIAKRLKNIDHYRFFPYLHRAELEVLLRNAYAFVYPTLNEGFGYPPIEAMRYGTPVIASAIASVTEVCKDAVLYVNPYSTDEIANRIIQMENLEIRSFYSRKALEQFSEIRQKQDNDLELLIMDILK